MRRAKFCLIITAAFIFTSVYAGKLRIVGSCTPWGLLNSKVIFLADQLENNLSGAIKSMPTVVATFVSVNNFDHTNTFGRWLTEALIHELQVRGWNVTDIRLSKSISMNKRGEFVLTRDSSKVKNSNVRVGLMVTGTYLIAGSQVIVNARVIDAVSGRVVSTAQAVVPIYGIEGLFAPDIVPAVKVE